jgi:hypothetical protein
MPCLASAGAPKKTKDHHCNRGRNNNLNTEREKPDDNVHDGGEKYKDGHNPNTTNSNPGR